MFVAGPNGSGKSTLTAHGVLAKLLQSPEDRPLIHINPDVIRREEGGGDDLVAAREADRRLDEAIEAGRSVIRETVLSTERLLASVRRAKRAGYRFILIFIFLRTPDLNVARVRLRVARGGHDVPEERVRTRWARSLALAPRFAAEADETLVFDNSAAADPAAPGAGPELLIQSRANAIYVSPAARAIVAGDAPAHSSVGEMLAALIGSD